MNFIDETIVDYAESMSSPVPDYLDELYRVTHMKVLNGRMISNHGQGRLLSFISKMMRPDLILDIGTFTGYSALCLAEGLSEKGKLVTLDINEEIIDIQDEFFLKAPFGDQIERVQSEAVEYLRNSAHRPQLIFLDADKRAYMEFWEILKERMDPGAVMIVDNVLWYGKVIENEKKDSDPSTGILQSFNQAIRNDESFETVMLPLRDGLTIIRKR